MKINESLNEKAKALFGEQNLDNVLDKAIVTGIQNIGEPQYIVVDHDKNVSLAATTYDIKGKVMVLAITYTRDDVVSYLKDAAPELVDKVDDPNWSWMLSPLNGVDLPPYESVDPITYSTYQDWIADSLNAIADTWF